VPSITSSAGTPAMSGTTKRGDTARLWDLDRDLMIDEASYGPRPPDGAILHRVGKELVSREGASEPEMNYKRRFGWSQSRPPAAVARPRAVIAGGCL